MNAPFKRFSAPFSGDDVEIATKFWADTEFSPQFHQAAFDRSAGWVSTMRKSANRFGDLEDFLREYGLSTKEGLALMCLAEALLRVPDGFTIDRLIEDKLGAQDWADADTSNSSALVSVSTWALALGSKIVGPEDKPDAIMNKLVKRLGMPSIRAATKQAMRFMGHHFVLGQNINEALKRGSTQVKKGYRYSFDMLGEGARNYSDANKYFESYKNAILEIGKTASEELHQNAGISIKLSALHPRYEARQADLVVKELTPKILELAKLSKQYNINLTIDAEEANRLELSLYLIKEVFASDELRGWDGFGLAIQAYSKRAPYVIDYINELCVHNDARMMVRLVKGAYWDSEIKEAHLLGASDFPVYTRKPMSDLSYFACAKKMLEYSDRIYSQFATHNALSVAQIVEMAKAMDLLDPQYFEFQRLHGMGDALYEIVCEQELDIKCRIYAPVGGHRDLLAYLVRRLLENGANSSFVHAMGDENYPLEKLLANPRDVLGSPKNVRHANIQFGTDIYGDARKNPTDIEFGYLYEVNEFMSGVEREAQNWKNHFALSKGAQIIQNPHDLTPLANVDFADETQVDEMVQSANQAFLKYVHVGVEVRAKRLNKLADLIEQNRDKLISLLTLEAGKTLDDGVAEWREAIDFCRYYADQALKDTLEHHPNLGPTGEENIYHQMGRGTFICISPWNFPLAIFAGQIVAALVTGNCVIAKPAETTPLIGQYAVELMHEAGFEKDVVQLIVGDGKVGGALVNHAKIAGVAFTGSTATARHINIALATKENAPIVPLIAETGGLNAMIVDATALPEQVCDDVINSAFHSAGQRCSALRVLYIQDDVYDKMINMIIGAAKCLKLGDPMLLDTDIGPVIDDRAKSGLEAHIEAFSKSKKLLYKGHTPNDEGVFVAPHIFEINSISDLEKEVFGPILHVVRFKGEEIAKVVDDINATGYGLTLGIHSRIDLRVQKIVDRANVGNIYVNRDIIGAVVGVQPFGGMGLSGTGPKAGGVNYLTRFKGEKVISYNSAAAGGNASLIASSGE